MIITIKKNNHGGISIYHGLEKEYPRYSNTNPEFFIKREDQRMKFIGEIEELTILCTSYYIQSLSTNNNIDEVEIIL